MNEETTKLPVLSENFDKQKEIYLSRPTAEKSWNEDVERQLEGLTAEQKGEVLKAANASHMNLVDLSPYIAMLVLSNRTLDTCAAGVQASLSSFESRLAELRRNESRSFEKTNYRITQMISQLDDSLQAILKRIDEGLELFDKTSTEAVENLKSKLEPEKIAAEATTQARRGVTKQIFKELSEKLKGYIEAEVQAEIHKRTTALNLIWVTAVILVGVAGFWMGKN